jgi:hypothetical protein
MVTVADIMAVDTMAAATTDQALMHTVAELATPMVGLRAARRAAASMVVVDVAKRPL